MNVELFIAKKIHFSTQQEGKHESPPAVQIAIIGIALGMIVMILAVAIVIGFKNEVRNKVIGFGSHIQVTHFDNNISYEVEPIEFSITLTDSLTKESNVKHFQRFVTKPGMIKTDSVVEGIVLKGVGSEYDLTFLSNNLVEGAVPAFGDSISANGVLLSKYLADRLNLHVGDSFLAYFLQQQVRARKLVVEGIYETGFSDYDKLFVMANLSLVQRLNGWDSTQVGGVEIVLHRFDLLDQTSDQLYFSLQEICNEEGKQQYYVRSIKDISPQIFSWLDMLDTNVWIILILMTLVAGFTMISGLLIIILERANMIGVLKALGAPNVAIRKVFLYVSLFLIGRGMIWGNVVGMALLLLQHFTHLVKLDAANYYVSYVPVEVNLLYWVLLNIATLVITLLMLVGPSYLIARIHPARSIRFE